MVLGDMFLWQDRLIPTALEALARSAGALATGEQYRNYTSGTANLLALGGRLIAQQYATGWSEGPARVVIMDGGGTDVLVGTCPEPPTVDCPILVDAVAAADELLGQMGADGVEDVIWVGYPGPADAVLRAKMELLQPLLQGVCAGSVVPCHWVDLEPAFADHYAEYMAADAIPTAAGADVAAAEIWSVMQRRCVAQ
jgi:hypothetical protein